MLWLKSLHSDRVINVDDSEAKRLLNKKEYRTIEGQELQAHLELYDMVDTDHEFTVYNPNIHFLEKNKLYHYGYAVLNDIQSKQLNKAGIRQVLRNIKNRPFMTSCSIVELEMHMNRQGPLRIVKTNWEAKTLPEAYVKMLNHFDYILTGREFTVNTMKECGVIKAVFHQPDGMDQRYFVDHKREKKDTFTFLHYNGGEWRKNTMGVISAFSQQFAKQENIKLIIKNSGIQEERAKSYEKYIHALYPQLSDRIEFIYKRLKVEEMIELGKRSDCFVFPTYGEGYGFPPLEMMAGGLPAIIPLHSSFSHIPADCVLPIEINGEIEGKRVYGGCKLWKPSQESLKEQMQWAVDNPSKLANIAKKGKEFVEKTENDDVVIAKWRENMLTIREQTGKV